ncbi:MAG: OmpA family protein [Woeseia sp.]
MIVWPRVISSWSHVALRAVVGTVLLAAQAAATDFQIEHNGAVLTVIGETSSDGHAALLRSTVAELFPQADTDLRLAPGAPLPAGWSLLTEQALRLAALLQTGSVTIDGKAVLIRGNYLDKAAWQRGLQKMQVAHLDGMEVRDEALAGLAVRDFAGLCQRQFTAALRGRRVTFRADSSEIRSAAYPLLDALVEIAADCPDMQVVITGHADASGNAEANRSLSQRRATAVLDYMTARGIAPGRLRAAGAGAARRLDTSGSRAARAQNRRIEFEFVLPD